MRNSQKEKAFPSRTNAHFILSLSLKLSSVRYRLLCSFLYYPVLPALHPLVDRQTFRYLIFDFPVLPIFILEFVFQWWSLGGLLSSTQFEPLQVFSRESRWTSFLLQTRCNHRKQILLFLPSNILSQSPLLNKVFCNKTWFWRQGGFFKESKAQTIQLYYSEF